MTEPTTITGNTIINLTDQMQAAWRTSLRFYGSLAVILFVVMVLPGFSPISLVIFAAMAAALVAIFVGTIAFVHHRLSNEQKQISYEIGTECIVVRDAAGSVLTFPWSIVRRLAESGSGFTVAMKPFGMRWFPKRAFTTNALAALRRLAREKLGPAARVKE